jgi:hypothetical protein
VRDQLLAWVEKHGQSPEAQFVYPAWLEVTREAGPVRDQLLAWLRQHKLARDAEFVYSAWLKATSETGDISESFAGWLREHCQYDEIDYVCRAWLDAKGDFELCRVAVLAWLERNWQQERAVYLLKNIARQQNLPIHAIAAVLRWCSCFASNEDAIWRLAQLEYKLHHPDLAEDFLLAAEAVLGFLFNTSFNRGTARCMIITLGILLTNRAFDAAAEERVDGLFVAVLRHPCIFSVDLQVPYRFQTPMFISKLMEAVDSGTVGPNDQASIERFLDWINQWAPQRKQKIRPLYAKLIAKHPERQYLWNHVQFEETTVY